ALKFDALWTAAHRPPLWDDGGQSAMKFVHPGLRSREGCHRAAERDSWFLMSTLAMESEFSTCIWFFSCRPLAAVDIASHTHIPSRCSVCTPASLAHHSHTPPPPCPRNAVRLPLSAFVHSPSPV